jgi:hypothetical protein
MLENRWFIQRKVTDHITGISQEMDIRGISQSEPWDQEERWSHVWDHMKEPFYLGHQKGRPPSHSYMNHSLPNNPNSSSNDGGSMFLKRHFA